MKKILLILDEFYPKESAIANVGFSLCEQLLKYNEELRIDVLCNRYGANIPGTCSPIDRLFVTSKLSYWRQNEILTDKYSKSNGIKKFYYRFLLSNSNKKEGNSDAKIYQTAKTAISMIKKNRYNCLIAFQYPYINVEVLLMAKNKLKDRIKTVIILSDPHADHINYEGKDEIVQQKIKEEHWLYQNVDRIITSHELFYNIKFSPIQEYKQKVSIIPAFPTLLDNTTSYVNNHNEYNFIFAGSLYSKMRSPSFCFKFFQRLPQNYKLHLFASSVSSEDMETIKKSDGRIILHESISKKELNEQYKKSDFVLNIGNRTNTQVASKVLEYLGCGKPIVNFFNIEDDTSRPYFTGYPLYFEVKENEVIEETIIKEFVGFCQKNKGKNLSFEQTYAHLPQLKSENITKIIYSGLFE